jgi:hypothetical protein
MKSYEIKSSFPFSLVDRIIPWNPLECLLRANEAPSIEVCSQIGLYQAAVKTPIQIRLLRKLKICLQHVSSAGIPSAGK